MAITERKIDLVAKLLGRHANIAVRLLSKLHFWVYRLINAAQWSLLFSLKMQTSSSWFLISWILYDLLLFVLLSVFSMIAQLPYFMQPLTANWNLHSMRLIKVQMPTLWTRHVALMFMCRSWLTGWKKSAYDRNSQWSHSSGYLCVGVLHGY